MHNLTLSNYKRPMSKNQKNAFHKQEQIRHRLGQNAADHMTYIFAIVLYDKMGMSWKKLDNCYTKLFVLRERWQDDADLDVTSESLLGYAIKKNIDLYRDYVLAIDQNDKLALANMKRGSVMAMGAIDSGLLCTYMLITPILKETYKFSNKKIDEFFGWVKYLIKMYNTKLPCEKGMVFDDEYIRQIFIEEQGFDMKKGIYV